MFFIMNIVRLNIQMFAHVTGDLVRAQRLQQGLSQAELARNAHVSRSVLSRLEGGKASVVQTDVLDRLFHALGCTPTLSGDTPDVRHQARLEQRCRLEQNRSRHLRLAMDLLTDARAAEPLIAKAKARVALWREKRSCSPYYIDRWSEALDLPPHQLAKAMGSFGEWEDAMFQNSPWSWAWS
jgi:transcriptional regulator with XRE-family HTH domain